MPWNLATELDKLTRGLHSPDGHEKSGAVPADLVKAFELVGNFGDGGSNNGLVGPC